jgi:hypothetical protein
MRMCPQCRAMVQFEGCDNLTTHDRNHSKDEKDALTSNACLKCGFFAKDIKEWHRWDGVVRINDDDFNIPRQTTDADDRDQEIAERVMHDVMALSFEIRRQRESVAAFETELKKPDFGSSQNRVVVEARVGEMRDHIRRFSSIVVHIGHHVVRRQDENHDGEGRMLHHMLMDLMRDDDGDHELRQQRQQQQRQQQQRQQEQQQMQQHQQRQLQLQQQHHHHHHQQQRPPVPAIPHLQFGFGQMALAQQQMSVSPTSSGRTSSSNTSADEQLENDRLMALRLTAELNGGIVSRDPNENRILLQELSRGTARPIRQQNFVSMDSD